MSRDIMEEGGSREDPDADLVMIAKHLRAIQEILRGPTGQRVGTAFAQNMVYLNASFRQRFPQAMQGAQLPLL